MTFISEFPQYHKLSMGVADFEDSIRKFSNRKDVDKITLAIGGLNEMLSVHEDILSPHNKEIIGDVVNYGEQMVFIYGRGETGHIKKIANDIFAEKGN